MPYNCNNSRGGGEGLISGHMISTHSLVSVTRYYGMRVLVVPYLHDILCTEVVQYVRVWTDHIYYVQK